MITAATVLWQGDFRGRNYTPDWVYKTQSMVKRNLSLPHQFVCFTNISPDNFNDSIHTIPLQYDLPGWWSKLELLNPELSQFFSGILFIDLDNLILESIDEITDYESDLTMTPGSGKSRRYINREGTITYHKYSSQLMYIKPGSDFIRKLWRKMDFNDAFYNYRGDQDYINSFVDNDLVTFPSEWFTRTKYVGDKKPDVKIVSGNPVKPDEAAEKWEWAEKVWK